MTADSFPPHSVVEQFGLDPATVAPLPGGLINASFGARRSAGDEVVLQRVNPIFPPAVHDDIDAVTHHLRDKGIITPVLIPAADGSKFIRHDGAIWRLLTRIEGETSEVLSNDARAREAGRVLGLFHAALADFDAPLANPRPPVHDLPRHLETLRRALTIHNEHPTREPVAAIAQSLFALADDIAPLPELPARLVHGDPKISNVVFADGRAVCLVDLDTLARFPAPLELGDALRSWCNLAPEDAPRSDFSLGRFAAAIEGYRTGAGQLLGDVEWRVVPQAALTIAVELAARFATDALEETYFAWDHERFPSAAAHNRARAAAQLSLARSMQKALPAMQDFIVTIT